MRTLERLKIPYQEHYYGGTEAISGVEVAAVLGEDPARTFKTLVTVGKSKTHYVFMVPVAEELDLKKAAAAVGEKAIEMIKSKELLRSEEHTSELQSQGTISYAVFCLKKRFF